MDAKKWKRILWKNSEKRWLIGLLIAASIWGFVDVRRRGHLHIPAEHRTDLTVYTEAGAAFFDGRAPYDVANARGWTYLYPPLLAMLMAPLHRFAEPNQVTVWFFISLVFCWGCWRECRRLIDVVCQSDPVAAAAWMRWRAWFGTAAVVTALLPTLNCLQRGQVGIVKLYFLLLGARLLLAGRSWLPWTIGGIVLALPAVLKVVPAMPVAFLMVLLLADLLAGLRRGLADSEAALLPRRFAFSAVGVIAGVLLFALLIPGALVGWRANLGYLNTWGHFMLTKADNGGMDPRSGNSHSARNQSLQNAAYRLGNFATYMMSAGPDDRLVENFAPPPMAMDDHTATRLLFLSRAGMILALLALGATLVRGDGRRLNLAVGFSLSCVAMLTVSPVARGHYFLMLAPAILLVPLWLVCHGRPRAAGIMASVLPPLCVLHYCLMPVAGRIGLLGLGTTAWLMAAMVIIARTQANSAANSCSPSPELPLASVAPPLCGNFTPNIG
ncbi:MAG: glycosyltransferase 87 family protein [Thermoguttaceae bacterium]